MTPRVRRLGCLLWLLAAATAAADREPPKDQAIGSVRAADLPVEARETLTLIRKGGPFRYPRDGITFGNRERLLPAAPRGSYREYTVPTPGRRDRGPRRIIAGGNGEFYYTADHYRSFRRILE